jgi:hypothetical protein
MSQNAAGANALRGKNPFTLLGIAVVCTTGLLMLYKYSFQPINNRRRRQQSEEDAQRIYQQRLNSQNNGSNNDSMY